MNCQQFLTLSCLALPALEGESGYEPEGREFESLRAHHLSPLNTRVLALWGPRRALLPDRLFYRNFTDRGRKLVLAWLDPMVPRFRGMAEHSSA